MKSVEELREQTKDLVKCKQSQPSGHDFSDWKRNHKSLARNVWRQARMCYACGRKEYRDEE